MSAHSPTNEVNEQFSGIRFGYTITFYRITKENEIQVRFCHKKIAQEWMLIERGGTLYDPTSDSTFGEQVQKACFGYFKGGAGIEGRSGISPEQYGDVPSISMVGSIFDPERVGASEGLKTWWVMMPAVKIHSDAETKTDPEWEARWISVSKGDSNKSALNDVCVATATGGLLFKDSDILISAPMAHALQSALLHIRRLEHFSDLSAADLVSSYNPSDKDYRDRLVLPGSQQLHTYHQIPKMTQEYVLMHQKAVLDCLAKHAQLKPQPQSSAGMRAGFHATQQEPVAVAVNATPAAEKQSVAP